MRTDKAYVPVLDPNKKYIFLLEHLEPAMEVEQLDRIVTKHNQGMDYKLIAKQEKRHPAEILIALIHQASTAHSQKHLHNRGNVEITRPLIRRLSK